MSRFLIFCLGWMACLSVVLVMQGQDTPIQQARNVGREFTSAWNEWAAVHDPAKISRRDIAQWHLIQEKFHRLEDVMCRAGYCEH